MEKKKRNIVIGVTSLLLATLILLGLTYAYYKTRIVGNSNEKSVSVTSKKYEVTYTDGEATLSTSGKIEPGFKFTKEFTVTNTGSESVNYSVILDNIENTYTRDQDWEYVLTKGDSEIATGTIAVGTHQVLIGSETLASGSQTYKLEVEYVNSEEDQSEDMGETMSFRVNISDETQTWDNATSGTLLYAIKNNAVLTAGGNTGSGETTPGQQASTSTEARILSTQDDYGTSYVYRGNVTNNYVTYSNMCWRIVRVQGDGTIKLALADENHSCGTANGYDITNGTSAFINDGETYSYGSSLEYKSGNIPTALNNWLTSKNLDTTKIVETEWCNDLSITGIVENIKQYRFLKDTVSVTLKCNLKGLNDTKSIRITSNIGTLTGDEVLYAGSTLINQTIDIYYLKSNTHSHSNGYLTMSPVLVGEGYGYTLIVSGDGGLVRTAWNSLGDNNMTIRPSIVLASNVTISATTQDGTVDNPYVIS